MAKKLLNTNPLVDFHLTKGFSCQLFSLDFLLNFLHVDNQDLPQPRQIGFHEVKVLAGFNEFASSINVVATAWTFSAFKLHGAEGQDQLAVLSRNICFNRPHPSSRHEEG